MVSHLSVSRPLLVLPKSQDDVCGHRKKGEPFEDATGCDRFNVLGQPQTPGSAMFFFCVGVFERTR